jgi:hypothetical protein
MTAEFPEAGELPESLPHPGPPLVLVVTVDADGRSSVRYTTDPEYAATVLRAIAQQIEGETLIG